MRWLLLLPLLFSFGPQPQTNTLPLADAQARHDFGEWIEFQARADSALQITEAQLVFSSALSPDSRILPATIESGNRLVAVYHLNEQPWIKPFTTVRYSFVATLSDGRQLRSSEYSYQYSDNHRQWQQLTSDSGIQIHWLEGDLAFGQAAANAAQRGLARFTEVTTLTQSQSANLYIYPSGEELRAALGLQTGLAASGHAAGQAGLAWLAAAPGPEQNLRLEQQVPHELAHVLLYQTFGADTTRLPTWLNEGVASVAELYPSPDYALVLARARERNALIPLADLCGPLPQDAATAILAYAQSESFVRFLLEGYGPAGVAAILQSYALGAPCEAGTQPPTGLTLSQLEAQWRRQVLSENPAGQTLANLGPWLLLGLLIIAAPALSIGLAMQRRK